MLSARTFPLCALSFILRHLATAWCFLALASITFLLSSCALGPDYVRPVTAIPAQFKEAAAGWKVAQPNDDSLRGPWWACFDDPQLHALITRVALSNQMVMRYEAAYRGARALVTQAQARYLPTVSLASSMEHRAGRGIDPAHHSYSLTLDASWEADIWNRVRNQVRVQHAGMQRAAAELANAQLSAQATLAQYYFELRALDAQQELLNATSTAYQKSLTWTQNRYREGAIARVDMLQAQTQCELVRAAVLDNRIARAQYEHAIATLVGEPASTFSIPVAPLHAKRIPIPLSIPSTLLERRPDIAAAERDVAAANAQIGVALAGFFPSLNLSASSGFQSTHFSQWFTAPARIWALGPQLAATLFDAGLRRAQTEAARTTYDQSVAQYRQTVLLAFQEVEDQLATLRLLESETMVQQQIVEHAQQALTIINHQYEAGTTHYLDVVTAQTTVLSAQKGAIDIAHRKMIATVALIKALGGGWSAS